MTVVTDYVLAVQGVVLGRRLWRKARTDDLARRLWAVMLLAMAVAALAGGTAHGFADRLSSGSVWTLWRVAVWGVGLASLAIASAAARFAFSWAVGRVVIVLFAIQFAVYAIWMIGHDDFSYVILEYLPAMVFVLAVSAWRWLGDGWRGGPWAVAGILISFVAAGVQASGFALHRHFNHNDLYHVIQMLGFYLMYRAGDMLPKEASG